MNTPALGIFTCMCCGLVCHATAADLVGAHVDLPPRPERWMWVRGHDGILCPGCADEARAAMRTSGRTDAKRISDCAQCAASYVTWSGVGRPGDIPPRWVIVDGALLCDDCVRARFAAQPDVAPPDFPVAFTPSDVRIAAGVERFFACFMPREQKVMLSFEAGHVLLSLAESEAIVACLSGANMIALGHHPAQAPVSPPEPAPEVAP